tara:strand:- start:246 stop:440 length:195 start_codon:yes stop_codon:yes gene_type:complete
MKMRRMIVMTSNEIKGIQLSQAVEWQGQDIFEVASAAFEDANYHSFNEVFTAAWNEFQKELQDG